MAQKMQRMLVTPDTARDWLERNTSNRRVSNLIVERYARDMASGNWRINGETIKLNGTQLIDGQHRLLACVQSDKPFESWVCLDLPENTFETIDTGKARLPADVMHIAGITNSTDASRLAAMMLRYEGGAMKRQRSKWSTTELLRWWQSHPEAAEACAKGAALYRQCRFTTRTVWAAAVMILGKTDEVDAHAYLSRVAAGEGLVSGTGALALRRALENSYKSVGYRDNLYPLALIIKAWNADRTNTAVQRVSFQAIGPKAESFPVPQ